MATNQVRDPALAGDWPAWLRRFLPTLLGGRRNESLPIEIHRKRILTLPTKRGVLFGAMLFVLLVGGLNYANNPALLLTFLLGAMGLVSLLHGFRNLLHLQVVALRSQPVFAGQPLHLEITIVSPNARPRYGIRLGSGEKAPVTDIEGGGQKEIQFEYPTTRRGWLKLSRLRLFTEYPMGLFVAWTWIDPAGRHLVYPAPEINPPPPPPALGFNEGHAVVSGDEDLVGFRDYRAGDPPRQIAWRASARIDRLMTREVATPRSLERVFDWQELTGMDSEGRISRLTAWVLASARDESPFTLRLPDRTLGPDAGTPHLHRCLRELALYRAPSQSRDSAAESRS